MNWSATRMRLGAAVTALLLAGIHTIGSSMAAFSSTTENAGNDWAAGTVTLTDNDSGVALFDNLTNLKPGATETDCIEVTYAGTLDAQVRMYGAATAGTGLEDYLDFTVERGTGTCAAFTPDTLVWDNATDGDLGVFLAGATNYATGVDAWNVTGGGPDDTVPYRITATLQDDDLAQGLDTVVTFTWEAQNT